MPKINRFKDVYYLNLHGQLYINWEGNLFIVRHEEGIFGLNRPDSMCQLCKYQGCVHPLLGQGIKEPPRTGSVPCYANHSLFVAKEDD